MEIETEIKSDIQGMTEKAEKTESIEIDDQLNEKEKSKIKEDQKIEFQNQESKKIPQKILITKIWGFISSPIQMDIGSKSFR